MSGNEEVKSNTELYESYTVASGHNIVLYYDDKPYLHKPFHVTCWESEQEGADCSWHFSFSTEEEARIEYERWRN